MKFFNSNYFNKNKNRVKQFLLVLSVLAMITIIFFNFAIAKHIAIPSISLAVLILCNLTIKLIDKDFSIGLPVNAMLCFLLLPLYYAAGCFIWSESDETFKYVFWLRTIIAGYAFGIFLLPKFKVKVLLIVFYALILSVCILTWMTFQTFLSRLSTFNIHYANNDFVNVHFLYIEAIPFNIYHHTLSFFTIFSILMGYYIIIQKEYIFSARIEYPILLIIILGEIFFLHFLGSRTGLIIFYGFMVYFLISQFFLKKVKLYSYLLILISVLTIPFFAYKYSPVLRIKADMALGEVFNYQSNERVRSFKVGINIIKNNFWRGISFSREKEFYDKYYHEKYPPLTPILKPHNQFIYYATLWGVPLTLFFAFCLYFPIIWYWKKLIPIAKTFFIIHTFYMMIDTPFTIKEYYYFYSFWAPYLIYQSLLKEKSDKQLLSDSG